MLLLALWLQDFVEVDFAKLDRTIAKEPAYVAEPRYALFIFDPAGKFRVWCALDKSKKDLGYYDVVYFDRNGNGDLTEEGEKFVGKLDEDELAVACGTTIDIRLGELKVPGADLVHTDLRIATVPKKDRKGVWFQMKYGGKVEVSGGHGPSGGIDTTVYGASPREAPVLRPTIEGPMSFALWCGDDLKIGGKERLNLLLGNAGSGRDTLMSVSENFLDLTKETIRATLIAADADGKEIRVPWEIKSHC